jgi:cell division septation protein DedD
MPERSRAHRQIWITRSHLVALGLATCCIALLAFLVGLQVGRTQAAAAEVVAEAPLPLTPDVSKEKALEALLREVEVARSSVGPAVGSGPNHAELTFPELLEPVEPALTLPQDTVAEPTRSAVAAPPGDAPAAPTPAAEPEAAPTSGWSVQIASHPSAAEADAMLEDLKAAGHDAYRVAALVDGQTWYRVRIGGFRSKNRAETARKSLQELLGSDDLLLTEAP